MFENLAQYWLDIASISIGGVSLISIVAFIIAGLKVFSKYKKELKSEILVTKEAIEEAFKNANLPTTFRIDISKKIEEPIKAGLDKIDEKFEGKFTAVTEQLTLCLLILSKLSHANKLTEDAQAMLKQYINPETIKDVEL